MSGLMFVSNLFRCFIPICGGRFSVFVCMCVSVFRLFIDHFCVRHKYHPFI